MINLVSHKREAKIYKIIRYRNWNKKFKPIPTRYKVIEEF